MKGIVKGTFVSESEVALGTVRGGGGGKKIHCL